jgi:hypothetical protein
MISYGKLEIISEVAVIYFKVVSRNSHGWAADDLEYHHESKSLFFIVTVVRT